MIFQSGDPMACAFILRVCSANKVLESDETEALFAAAVAIETGPQTMLQFTVIALVGTNLDYRRWFPSPILIISLLFSFLSASYNIGRAVMFKLSKQWSFALNAPGIAGGNAPPPWICNVVSQICVKI